LHGVLSNNAQANAQKQPFEEQQNNLIGTILEVPVEQLTRAQENVLEVIGIRGAVSIEGRMQVEDILFRNQLDIANAAEKIQEIIQAISNGIQWNRQTKTQLDLINADHLIQATEPGEVLLRVKFTKDASIDNVVEWSEWSDAWLEIARGISMATGGTPEDVRIIGASRGSFVLDLVSVAGFAKAVSYILKEVLDRVQQLVEIKKAFEEVRGLKIENNKAALELEQAIAEHKEKSIIEVTEKSVAKITEDVEMNGEDVSVLKRAIKRLFEFFDKGGEVDVRVPEPEITLDENGEEITGDGEVERAELASLVEDIRRLENQIKKIGYDPSD